MSIYKNYKHTLIASYLGYITLAVINNFAPLLFLTFQALYQIPLEKITFLITINFGIQLLVDLLATIFVDKIGYRISIVAAHIFPALGLFGLGIFPAFFRDPYTGLLLAVTFYAIGGGLIEVLVSPIVEACPTQNKSANMSFLHSFYCWGTFFVILVSTLFFHLAGIENWGFLALIWGLLPALNALYFSQVPLSSLTAEGESIPIRKLLSLKMFWLFVFLMIAAGASELAMSQWASAFTESSLGVAKNIGDLAGPGFFAILMGFARVFYAKFSKNIELLKFIIGSSVLCVLSYLLTSLTTLPLLSLLGFGLCGLSVGILWPGIFSIAAKACPRGGTAMFALLALAGDLGCSGEPTLVGMISGVWGDNLKIGLLAGSVFPLTLLGLSLWYKKAYRGKPAS